MRLLHSLSFCKLFVFAVLAVVASAQAPNSVIQDFINQLRTLVPGSLGELAGKLGITATYDYVVVGAGTAGTALAVRLAQSGAKVALVEAGAYYEITNPIISSTPGLDVLLVGSDITNSNPLVDWNFVATNQPGTNYRPIHFARGKCVGGS
jgi:D-arabinose 5-phosphate isomerase GutQ